MTTNATSEQIEAAAVRHGAKIEGTPNCVSVKVWQAPVRIVHWTIFFSVLILALTGAYIANPYIITSGDTGFVMGTARGIHEATAWVFIIAIVARLVWAFLGNRWARWDQFLPVHRERRVWLLRTLKYYLFLRREPPPAAGHNPLAGLTYSVVFLMFGVQILTGMSLEALENPGGWKWFVSGWVFNILSIPVVRMVHHLIMWLTIGFVIHHVYSAILVDFEERSGLVSSIITGYKRLPLDRL